MHFSAYPSSRRLSRRHRLISINTANNINKETQSYQILIYTTYDVVFNRSSRKGLVSFPTITSTRTFEQERVFPAYDTARHTVNYLLARPIAKHSLLPSAIKTHRASIWKHHRRKFLLDGRSRAEKHIRTHSFHTQAIGWDYLKTRGATSYFNSQCEIPRGGQKNGR